MVYDCVIIGGGPAGLSAALVLGRAKLNVLLIDNNDPRNKVTNEAHGFITNDSLSPFTIREKAKKDLLKYSNIQLISDTVADISDQSSFFIIETLKNNFETKRIILATGLKETLPNVKGLESVYGDLFFNCPFCDGWELKNQKLAIIVEQEEHILHFSTMIFHWSKQLTVFTNGMKVSDSIKSILAKNEIELFEDKIESIEKKDSKGKINLHNSQSIEVYGGFLAPQFELNMTFAKNLSITLNDAGRIQTDEFGSTSFKNVYAAGDSNATSGEQLVHSASSGSKVASGIVKEIAFENFITDK
ncbi:NAD(P)/FAD-dependent oxidoreductase [Carnobacterium sp.]|uniref:NAD(P)/FAD-dependent oxidoreductase n=1 Tax=Carnobacterium sp. TaxID=48221 RepID=UPI00388EE0FF